MAFFFSRSRCYLEPKMTRPTSLLLSAVAAVCVAITASAQEAQKPAVTQAVLAGKLIDVRTGAVRSHAYILIAGDRIQSIADSAPPGINVTDLAEAVGMGANATSHALSALRLRGIVRSERAGRERRWSIASDEIHALLHQVGATHSPLHPEH